MNYLNLKKLKRSEGSYLSEAYEDGTHSEMTMYISEESMFGPDNTNLTYELHFDEKNKLMKIERNWRPEFINKNIL